MPTFYSIEDSQDTNVFGKGAFHCFPWHYQRKIDVGLFPSEPHSIELDTPARGNPCEKPQSEPLIGVQGRLAVAKRLPKQNLR
jgi:hypothetical protein